MALPANAADALKGQEAETEQENLSYDELRRRRIAHNKRVAPVAPRRASSTALADLETF
jgi:hypothetical protein